MELTAIAVMLKYGSERSLADIENIFRLGLDVNALVPNVREPLLIFARSNLHSVKLLVKYGADVNKPQEDVGNTILHLCGHNLPLAEYLLTLKGINLYARNRWNCTPEITGNNCENIKRLIAEERRKREKLALIHITLTLFENFSLMDENAIKKFIRR